MNIYNSIKSKKKQFALLIDPDKAQDKPLEVLVKNAAEQGVDYIFAGGSYMTNDNFNKCVNIIKQNCSIPVVLFPGSTLQISDSADAILFLSLISGRNPELLIGNHVMAAPILRKAKIEIIPTGYMLVNSGKCTSAVYMSNTMPLPYDKNDLARYTAIAGEMLGLKCIYIDAGSGADKPVSVSMIKDLRENINVPLIVGGGINSAETAIAAWEAGADIIVVGNAIEKNPLLLKEICQSSLHY